jgi:hypothetical protein
MFRIATMFALLHLPAYRYLKLVAVSLSRDLFAVSLSRDFSRSDSALIERAAVPYSQTVSEDHETVRKLQA